MFPKQESEWGQTEEKTLKRNFSWIIMLAMRHLLVCDKSRLQASPDGNLASQSRCHPWSFIDAKQRKTWIRNVPLSTSLANALFSQSEQETIYSNTWKYSQDISPFSYFIIVSQSFSPVPHATLMPNPGRVQLWLQWSKYMFRLWNWLIHLWYEGLPEDIR